MANVEQGHGAQDISQVINHQIANKIEYLKELKTAVDAHDDKQVYQLLDNKRYAAEIEHREQQPNDQGVMNLVDDLADQLSTYLSGKLIKYLGHTYPFFYYEEYQTGHFRVYFGNWWDRRLFGELDVLNLRFVFKKDEYQKLQKSFELSKNGKRYNSAKIAQLSNEDDHLQNLIDKTEERERQKSSIQAELRDNNSRGGLFESSRTKENRQSLVEKLSQLEDDDKKAETAADTIKANEKTVLELSKENTILSYEQKSINDTFGSFDDFELANRNLYANYLHSLDDEKAGDK